MARLTSDLFPTSYSTATKQFVTAAQSAGFETQEYVNPCLGANGETLSTTVAVFQPGHATHWLMVSSGVHGVEGYAGSACQCAMLNHFSQQAPFELGILLVHAVNPFGFSYNARTDENNVDLNRHFVDFKALPDNSTYNKIHSTLIPTLWNDTSMQRIRQQLFQGRTADEIQLFLRRIYRGQYQHPDGLFYGGQAPSWAYNTLKQIYQDHLTHAEHVAALDVHTGLGVFGEASLIFCQSQDPQAFERANLWLPRQLTSWHDNNAPSTQFTGKMMTGLSGFLPDTPMTNITIEFGTYSQERIMPALLASNWLRTVGMDHPQAASIQAIMHELFCPNDQHWQSRILDQFQQTVQLLLTNLHKEQTMKRSSSPGMFTTTSSKQKWTPGPTGNLKLLTAEKPLQTGDAVPEGLIISDSNGTEHNISKLAAASTVVIFIYPGNGEGTQFGEPGMWGCTPESCSFNNAHAIFSEAGITVFGMSLQSAVVQNKFIKTKNLAFPILNDPEHKFIDGIGINIYQVKEGLDRSGEQFPQRTTIIMKEGEIHYIERAIIIGFDQAEADAQAHVEKIKCELGLVDSALQSAGGKSTL